MPLTTQEKAASDKQNRVLIVFHGVVDAFFESSFFFMYAKNSEITCSQRSFFMPANKNYVLQRSLRSDMVVV